MYTINKITSDTTVDFSAVELKKYLRMMMPRAGEIPISFPLSSDSGFRLGLMSDFGLETSDAEDVSLDDIIYIDTDEKGGIIAGSNRGALLIAVYRYLRFCGCRWLFPGVDGEFIPIIDKLSPVKYRKKADHRYRGQCNEGAEFQQNMLETIDFTPKIGMNTYMLEFDIPFCYYNTYYNHSGNSVREPEPVTNETVLQWKRQCEVEIQKRGLHFHDMGHGWTAEPFGLDSKLSTLPETIPESSKRHLAMINGERNFYRRVIDTNVCMSNPETRRIMADYIADYAQTQSNVDFLHIWLADGIKNHCECDGCRKKITPDWYVILLNDIDAEMTRRNLDTKLVFIVYTETFWPPLETRLNNPERFTMLFAPIFRKYTETYAEEPDMLQLTPYNLNNNEPPRGMAGTLAYLVEWKKLWPGDCFCYEYHFWRHQCYDPSGMYLAKLLYDDIRALRKNGLDGIIEDGSQRSYFPTGFAFYVYGETLFDSTVSYDELKKDYFSHSFGSDWEKAVEYLEKIRDLIPFAYMSALMSADNAKGAYYNPSIAESASEVAGVSAEFQAVIDANRNKPIRVQTVSWRLLDCYRAYADGIAEAVTKRAVNDAKGSKESFKKLIDEFSKREIYIERNFDLGLYHYSLRGIFGI